MAGTDHRLHSWNLDAAAAVELQRRLRDEVRLIPLAHAPRTIAGADISFNRFSDTIYAGIVVLRRPDLTVIDQVTIRTTARFPYRPGLLSFRELPALLEAWERLSTRPDLLMLDGHGLAHPRRFGLACHAGLLLDLPTIGCAKSRLIGHHAEPGAMAGDHVPLLHRPTGSEKSAGSGSDEVIGVALRTKRRVAPIFVSPGHLIDLPDAIRIVTETARQSGYRYRQPEPTRLAHLLVNERRRRDLPGIFKIPDNGAN